MDMNHCRPIKFNICIQLMTIQKCCWHITYVSYSAKQIRKQSKTEKSFFISIYCVFVPKVTYISLGIDKNLNK